MLEIVNNVLLKNVKSEVCNPLVFVHQQNAHCPPKELCCQQDTIAADESIQIKLGDICERRVRSQIVRSKNLI